MRILDGVSIHFVEVLHDRFHGHFLINWKTVYKSKEKKNSQVTQSSCRGGGKKKGIENQFLI